MSDAELVNETNIAPKRECRLISSVRQLKRPPKLRHIEVDLPHWETEEGFGVQFLAWELSALEHSELIESGWVYKGGLRHKYNDVDANFRFLAYVLRDEYGNRLWHEWADAKAFFRDAGQQDVAMLVRAGNEMNQPKEASTQGNSGETQNAS